MQAFLRAASLALALVLSGLFAAKASAQEQAIPKELIALEQGLKPQQGKVPITAAKVTLDLGNQYDFYGPADARTVLVDLWGNPPENANGVLGIVMPAGQSPLNQATWGAVITYEESGWVDDADAADADYAQILSDLKQGTEDANADRKSDGYPAIHVMGWAENPRYDPATHSVVWASNLQFEGNPLNTLNYDLRTLGRGGVLSVNFIAGMDRLADIRLAAANFAQHASFDQGARYEDFDPSLDKKAEYGVGGLVAAGVGVAVAKKLGLLAVLLKFGKFIVFGLIAVLVAARKFLAGLFGGKERDEDYDYYAPPEADPAPPADLSGVPGERSGDDPPR